VHVEPHLGEEIQVIMGSELFLGPNTPTVKLMRNMCMRKGSFLIATTGIDKEK